MKVLITGAASGLGKALALRYAKAGAEICVVDLNQQEGEAVVSLIEELGGSAFFASGDITEQKDVDDLVSTVKERWGGLDVLINNAGVATAGLLAFENIESWQWVMNVNLLGHVRMTKAFVPLIENSVESNKSVINIASQAGLTVAPGMGSYSASKAAMVSFSETLYLELVHDNIHVSVVCPAFFDTNLNKSLRSDQPGMDQVVNKLIKDSGVGADEIAEKVFNGVMAKEFMIITHETGRDEVAKKQAMPIDDYLSEVAQYTRKFVKTDD